MIKFLKNIALLEFIPTKEVTDVITDLIGLEKDANVLNDMGLMFIIGVAMLLALVFLVLVSQIVTNFSFNWYRRYRKIK